MKILANDGISKAGEKALLDAGMTLVEHKVSQEQLINFINENQIEVLLVRSATQARKELIDSCPSLKIIGRGGVGMDNIDVDYAKSKGIIVINTPSASSRSVAEMVFAHFFSLARYLHDSNRMMPLEGETQFNTLKKSYNNAIELQSKTLGIIGFGGIGKEVAKIGISLGMKIKVLTRNPKSELIELDFFDGQRIKFKIDSIQDWNIFLKDTDFISINTPKTDGYLIDHNEFEKMKDGVYIVNTARGGTINENTLLEYLDNGKVAGAALDVFENEPQPKISVLMNPQISLSPHLGGNTKDAQEKIGTELAEQIIEIQKSL
ncbi:MAG: 3-phosphoglycerate dehydrogenase [Bacteroidetes bacterium]|nr:3-phosphoglycerate dehydrogenase [Bacteroidota bacterium]